MPPAGGPSPPPAGHRKPAAMAGPKKPIKSSHDPPDDPIRPAISSTLEPPETHAMSIASSRLSLSPAARDFLLAEFRAIARPSPSSSRRRSEKVAITYRTTRKGRDALPDRPIPIEEFRLAC